MRVKLEGNHSGYHGGCAAVWSVLQEALLANGCEIVSSDDFDTLVINGEGSMHHGRPTFHRKMRAAQDAIARGKEVYLVNSVWEENPADYDDVLAKLAGLSVRETRSADDLARRHGVKATVCLDFSLFASAFETVSPGPERRGEAVTDYLNMEAANFVPMPARFQEGREALILSGLGWGEIVSQLRSRKLLVTGRHHAVCAAIRARTPFAAIEGNSHKISGLIDTTGVAIPVARHVDELDELIDWARGHPESYARFFDRIAEIGRAREPRSVLPSP